MQSHGRGLSGENRAWRPAKRQDEASQRRRLRNGEEQSRLRRVRLAHAARISILLRQICALRELLNMPYHVGTDREDLMSVEVTPCIRTLRLKVKSEAYAWLNAAAIEVNQVWNFANATSYKALRPFFGPPQWLSGYDLDKLTAGASQYFEKIGSGTIQRVNAELATRRRQFKKAKLRWRVSRGSRRSLGWVPFKGVQLKHKGKSTRFSGKAFRVFEAELLEEVKWKSGCFAQDAVGDWWLCVAIERLIAPKAATHPEVGLDLGLKDIVTTSDGEKLEAGHFYRHIEQSIAQAQRRAHPHQAKRLHRTAARRRKDALHKFSRRMVNRYQTIIVGDVSSPQLAKTRMAKSVLDAAWGMLRAQLQSKGHEAGRSVLIVSERNTTRTCSRCGALTGPTGLDRLAVRVWKCSGCGDTHDRDVNAARNILLVGRCPPSVTGNEPSPSVAPPSQASRRCEAGTSALTAAA
jgi:IS605 OrfB family transposase